MSASMLEVCWFSTALVIDAVSARARARAADGDGPVAVTRRNAMLLIWLTEMRLDAVDPSIFRPDWRAAPTTTGTDVPSWAYVWVRKFVSSVVACPIDARPEMTCRSAFAEYVFARLASTTYTVAATSTETMRIRHQFWRIVRRCSATSTAGHSRGGPRAVLGTG